MKGKSAVAFGKARLALAAIAVTACVAAFASPPASAYSTYRNWYSMTWVFNKSETYQVAWVMSNPANFQSWNVGPIVSGVAAVSWNTVHQIARQARSSNACLAIYWIYVNIPIPEIYRGAGCY
jgi:hypothetical protein